MNTVTQPNNNHQTYQWKDLISMMLEYKPKLIKANLIAILGTIAAVPVPLFIPILIDEVLLNSPASMTAYIDTLFPASWHSPILYILIILLITVLLRLTALIFGVIQMRQFTCISKNITFRMRSHLLRHMQKVKMSTYEMLGSATIASHLVTDIDTIDQFIGESTSKLLVAILSIIGTAIVLLWMHWPLAIFILLFNPLIIWITTIFGRRVKRLKAIENRAYQNFQESIAETFNAMAQIRASNREAYYIQQIEHKADKIRHDSTHYTWKNDAALRLSSNIFLLGFDSFRALGMLMVLFSGLSIGEMLAVFAYLWFMMQPVNEILSIQYAYSSANAALERVNTLLKTAQETQYPHHENPFSKATTCSIQLHNIHFRYTEGPLVLNNVSLDIQLGEKVALVGSSGGGKTTLVQIILGFYEPAKGKLLFDHINVKNIGQDIVRENIATVLQHPFIFNETVRLNLTMGNHHSDKELWKALKIAQLDDQIEKLEAQLDTLLGQNGIRLSGGQRQRLAIARMVLRNPKIVILDEATSALDTKTEEKLHQALNQFLKGRTTLIIAHRLSAVKQADRALVFADGQIIENGHHDQLLKNKGLYASLYGSQ